MKESRLLFVSEMQSSIFDERLYKIEGECIECQLIDTYEEKDGALPFSGRQPWNKLIIYQKYFEIA